jgi:transcriptional regulator
MLYMPPAFHQKDTAQLHADIAAITFASLITVAAKGPIISHIPLMYRDDGTPHGSLVGHLARGNPQWQLSDLAQPAVAVFMGPQAYISPSWYPSKQENPRVVPTWNYAVVHVTGQLEVFDDVDRLLGDVARMTDSQEQRAGSDWKTSDAPMDFMIRQAKGIVGIRLVIASIEGKSKLSQNRAEGDQAHVASTLQKSSSAGDQAVAAAMAQVQSKR